MVIGVCVAFKIVPQKCGHSQHVGNRGLLMLMLMLMLLSYLYAFEVKEVVSSTTSKHLAHCARKLNGFIQHTCISKHKDNS